MDRSADDRLFNAAASISDGFEIDWKDVGRAAVDEETTAIVVQLQVVEQIARVHSAPGSRVLVPGSRFQGPDSVQGSRARGRNMKP